MKLQLKRCQIEYKILIDREINMSRIMKLICMVYRTNFSDSLTASLVYNKVNTSLPLFPLLNANVLFD